MGNANTMMEKQKDDFQKILYAIGST